MSLSDLTFKRTYDSYTDNIVDDFFNAALQETSLYRRAAAYFSSSTFKALSVGLGRLFSNGGKMEAIVSVILEEEDYEAIVRGIADREETIAKLFPDLQSAKNILEDSSVEALYRLIASSRLQMKFVLSKRGIFHMKFGIMQDESGKMISFSGSINETMQGYLINGEEFKVFREWAEGEREFVHDDLEKFNSYWNGKFPTKDVITSDLPSKVIQRISKLVEEATGKQKESGEYVPRPYQKEAASEWIKNGYRGIIEMATGTGKTNVAIDIIAQVLSRMQPLLVIISVPTKELLRQWSSAIESRIGVEAFEASAAKVKAALRSIDNLFWMPPEQKIFIMIGTYAYLSKASFGELFTKSGIEKLLIADEVHSAGAESFSRILREEYGMRLGLSATPARHFDDAGTEKIMGYFGGIVFSYTLEQAISDGYLVPFSYYPEFVDLTLNEMKSYLKLTRRYINMISKSDTEDDGLVGNPVDLILIQRAKITKKAANKFAKLGEIISKLAAESNLAYTLVYYEDKEQLKLGNTVLDSLGVTYSIVSAEASPEERKAAIDNFESGKKECLCSMRVMDEGINITSIRNAIILSSSENPRQLIQRAGRALRTHSGKDSAMIFEVSATPPAVGLDPSFIGIEKGIAEKELKRMAYFCKAAKNDIECFEKLEKIAEGRDISVWKYL